MADEAISPPPPPAPLETVTATLVLDRLARTGADAGALVDALSRWEELRHGRGPGQILELLPKIAGEIPVVEKDGENQHQRFRYKSVDAIYDAATEVIARHGVTVLQRLRDVRVVERRTAKDKTTFHVTLTMILRFEAPDGSWREIESIGESSKTDDKSHSAAISIAKKYGLIHAFGIRTNEPDHDGEPLEQPAPQAQQQQQQRPPSNNREAAQLAARSARALSKSGQALRRELGKVRSAAELEQWFARLGSSSAKDRPLLLVPYSMASELLEATSREAIVGLKTKWLSLTDEERELLDGLRRHRWEELAPKCGHENVVRSQDGDFCNDCGYVFDGEEAANDDQAEDGQPDEDEAQA